MFCVSDLNAFTCPNISKSCQKLPFFANKINFCGNISENTKDSFVKNSTEIPKYFLHFTDEATADKIIESGEIDVTTDGIDMNKKGVFMVDLQNLVKNWTKQNVQADDGSFNLLTCLFGHTTKG